MRRVRFDPDTGKVVATHSIAHDVQKPTRPTKPMAGFVNRVGFRPVALYTPDDRSLYLQRGRTRIDLDEPGLVVAHRAGPLFRKLVVRSPSTGRRLRIRATRLSEPSVHPMDDPWLVTLHDFATDAGRRQRAMHRWDAKGVPEGIEEQ